MPPKKQEAAKEEPPEPPPDEQEPAVPEILSKCFVIGGQLYYGDCKVGYGERKGTFVRHGFGQQIDSAVTPVGSGPNGGTMYETVVMRCYEGRWENDSMVQGSYKWGDGSSYEGAFSAGRMHGHGRFAWPDGSAFEGSWHIGHMEGPGRFDSRYDGRFQQGRFQRSCFQRPDGRWMDLLEQLRAEECHLVIQGDPSTLAVRRLACGELVPAAGKGRLLDDTMASIHAQGLVPFIIADDSLAGSALDCLELAGLTDSTKQCASLRLAATLRRRQRDHQRIFRDALRHSLQSGTHFVMALEDDDVGCAAVKDENLDWFKRKPEPSIPSSAVPEDWRLQTFFDPSSLPTDIFVPVLFNGRLRSVAFLPESAEGLVPVAAARAPGAGGSSQPAAAPPNAALVEGETAPEPGAAPRALVAAAAAPSPPCSVGLTGHRFEVAEGTDMAAAGLAVVRHLRPAVLALARLPAGLTDLEVRERALERYRRHVPLHRTALVVLSATESAAAG